MQLGRYKALTFDVYGTLIDWETGMVNGLKPLTDKVSTHLTRNAILEAHAYHESSTQRQTPGKNLLAAADGRIQAPCGRVGRSDEPGGMRYLREIGKALARIPRQRGSPRLSERSFQTRRPIECRQCQLRAQQQEARREVRCGIYGGRYRLLQTIAAQFRIYDRKSGAARNRQGRNSPYR